MQELSQQGVTPEDIEELESLGVLDDSMSIAFIKQKLNEAKRPARVLMRAEKFIADHFSIRLNIISNQIEFIASKSYSYEKLGRDGNIINANSETFEEWRECKAETIERALIQNHIPLGSGKIKSLLRSDYVTEFNPVAEYFTNLKYTKAIAKQYKAGNPFDELCNYLKVEEPEKFKIQFKKQLIRTIKCAIDPSFFNKHCFVLMSDEQNPGKSSFLRWLCPPDLRSYYAEDPPLDKDGLIAIASNFIINLDELSNLYRKDQNLMKSWMSKEYVQVRRPYSASVENIPRIASFFGSTNKDDFLIDETGNVRWIVFRLKKGKTEHSINWNYKKDIDINHLWAYIYQCYLDGEEYNLTSAEIKNNEDRNSGFSYISKEMELVSKYFEVPPPFDKNLGLPANVQFLMATEILIMMQNKTYDKTLNHRTVGTALKNLGFEKTHYYTAKGDQKGTLPGYFVIEKVVTPEFNKKANEANEAEQKGLPF